MHGAFRFLGHHQWSELAKAAAAPELFVCDLSRTMVVYPPGVVALALITHARAEAGRATRLVLPPTNHDVLNYLGRIDFFEHIHPDTVLDGDVSSLSRHRRNPSSRFTELIAIREQGFGDVAEVVWTHLKEQSLEEAQSVFPAFEELLTNIAEHSAPGADRPARCLVQVQMYAGEVDLAFGDLGLGYLATLRQNPELPSLAVETEALRGVLVEGYSRLGHRDEDRGGGLRHVHDTVRRLEGRMELLSKDGLARADAEWGGRRGAGPEIRTERLPIPFPGTMAWIQLPGDRAS